MGKSKKANLHFVTPDEVHKMRNEFGTKIENLATLLRGGFSVPMFVAIPSNVVLALINDDEGAEEVAKSACAHLGVSRYVVRSSALAEDSRNASHAGEFLSIVDVSESGVKDAMLSVVRDARQKGYATNEKPFSVIVQEFIKGDVAGVMFTRNPLGGRESVIEWRRGGAEGVVGGAPVSRIYQNADAHTPKELFAQQKTLFTTARKIEDLLGEPVDIEWVVRDGKLFILQSRPITTIPESALAMYRSIDAFTQEKDVYVFSRSGIGESFATCTPLALDLLRMLYRAHGPIVEAYHILGVDVRLTDNFLLLHGSLYVDGVKEIKQFFPAYSYATSVTGMVPKITHWKGLIPTLRNARRLSGLSAPHPRLMQERLTRHALDVEELARAPQVSLESILGLFDRIYQDIFLINLYAEDAFRRAEKSLHRIPFRFVELLALGLKVEKEHAFLVSSDLWSRMKGNSLNIGDKSDFVVHHKQVEAHPQLVTWWGNLPGKERVKYEKIIRHAKEYQEAREEGRHLAVLLVSMLREVLQRESGVKEELIYFATLRELSMKSVSNGELLLRKTAWEKGVFADMPSIISTLPFGAKHAAIGVSTGVASGNVVSLVGQISPECILFVERLTPHLAPHLVHVKGIIALEGGILSHMAICAREAGVPVVIDPSAREKIKNGMHVTIDGGAGTITIH